MFFVFFTPILNPTYRYWLWLILKQSESSKCCSTDFRPLWLKKVLLISFGNEMWFLFVQNCCSLEWTTTQVSATTSCSSSAVRLGCHAFPPCRHAVWSSSFLIMIFFLMTFITDILVGANVDLEVLWLDSCPRTIPNDQESLVAIHCLFQCNDTLQAKLFWKKKKKQS